MELYNAIFQLETELFAGLCSYRISRILSLVNTNKTNCQRPIQVNIALISTKICKINPFASRDVKVPRLVDRG
jgi:hypothetical protein